jgi:penicillin-binding protein 1C
LPKGVISARIGVEGDPEPHRTEIFLKGTEPATDLTVMSMPSASTGRTEILYPPDNAIMALDPDIPPEHQIIFFKAANADSSLWMLDGRVIATASTPFRWSPMSGRHVLALVGSTGEAVDTVRFEIRGMFDLSDRENKDDTLGF